MSDTSSGVIFLQRANDGKVAQARSLRRHMTLAEQTLWDALRDRRCNGLKFRRQQVIEGFIADFFCHSAKLVVEVDGAVHQDAEQQKSDCHRRAVFESRGLKEIRFTNEDVLGNLDAVLDSIKSWTSPRPSASPLLSDRGRVGREHAKDEANEAGIGQEMD